MKEKTCSICGETHPATLEFFGKNGFSRHGKPRLRPFCRNCCRQRTNLTYLPEPERLMWEVNRMRPVKCSGRSPSLVEYGKCIHVQCRYHMLELDRRKINNSVDPDIVAENLIDSKYTCLWEIFEKEKTPLVCKEIGDIIGVSKQRVEQIESSGKRRFKSYALAIFFDQDVSVPEQESAWDRIASQLLTSSPA